MSDVNIRIAPTLSILNITPDYRIYSTAPMPNWFRRLWYWILLGWTWENYK